MAHPFAPQLNDNPAERRRSHREPPAHKLPNELSSLVLTDLNLRDLIRVWQSACQPFARNAYHVVRLRLKDTLKPLDIDVDTLLNALDGAQAVISGSSILGLLDPRLRHFVLGSDFDIYCPLGANDEVIQFFVDHGFELQAPQKDPNDEDDYEESLARHINSVRTLIKEGANPVRIDVVESDTQSPLSPITRFHSTVMRTHSESRPFLAKSTDFPCRLWLS